MQKIIPWQPAEVTSRKRLARFEAVLGFVLTCGYTRNAKNKKRKDSLKTGKTHAWVAFGEGCKEMWQKCYAVDFLLNICGCQSLFQSHELRSQHLHCWPRRPPEEEPEPQSQAAPSASSSSQPLAVTEHTRPVLREESQRKKIKADPIPERPARKPLPRGPLAFVKPSAIRQNVKSGQGDKWWSEDQDQPSPLAEECQTLAAKALPPPTSATCVHIKWNH